MQFDPIFFIPVQRVDEDVAGVMSTSQDAGEEDAVVIARGLVSEDYQVKAGATVAGEYLLGEPCACHPIPDDHESLLSCHLLSCSSWPVRSMRTAQTFNSGILLVGSRAGFVKRLTDCFPPQWKG